MPTGMKKIANLVSTFTLLFAGTTLVSAQQPPLAPAQTPSAPAAAALAPVVAVPTTGPKIAFETPVYDFGKVKSGEMIKHTFIFTNIGQDLLILTNVQPSCGCTTAGEWTRQVEPGKTGTIPIQFNSANYNGQVMKTVTVTCNDKSQQTTTLQVKGTIWKPIDVNPAFAVLNIPPDMQSNVSSKVHIVNNMDDFLTLSPPETSSKSFTTTLVTNTPGKDYDLMITAVPPFDAATMQAQITMKTSSTNAPNLTVTAWANVQPAVTINPIQLMVPAAPLVAKHPLSITIQNNSSKPLKLTDPAVDIKDVEVKVTETNPGKTFNVTLNFPEGFELKGGKGLFTANSDNPKFAQIKVPISQLPKPVAIPGTPQVLPLRPVTPAATPVPAPAPASASTAKPAVQQ